MNTQELIEWLREESNGADNDGMPRFASMLRKAADELERLSMVAQAVVDNATVEMPPALIRMAESALGVPELVEVQGRVEP